MKFNKTRIIKQTIPLCTGIIISVFLFISCASIPSPKNEEDTLLVISTGIINRSNEAWYGNYSFVIERVSDGKEVKIKKIPRNDGFTWVSGLAPGEYRVRELVFFNNSKSFEQEKRIKIPSISFVMEAGGITIFGKKFIYAIDTPMNSGQPLMKYKFIPLGRETIDELLSGISEDRNYSKWNIIE